MSGERAPEGHRPAPRAGTASPGRRGPGGGLRWSVTAPPRAGPAVVGPRIPEAPWFNDPRCDGQTLRTPGKGSMWARGHEAAPRRSRRSSPVGKPAFPGGSRIPCVWSQATGARPGAAPWREVGAWGQHVSGLEECWPPWSDARPGPGASEGHGIVSLVPTGGPRGESGPSVRWSQDLALEPSCPVLHVSAQSKGARRAKPSIQTSLPPTLPWGPGKSSLPWASVSPPKS